MTNSAQLLIVSTSGGISILETLNTGGEIELASINIQGVGNYTLGYISSKPTIKLKITGMSGTSVVGWTGIGIIQPSMKQEYYLVDICEKDGDRYRFGFNGQEKVNEIAGIGNHTTAEFGEYDSRLRSRWNPEPNSNVSWSDYSLFFNNPI